MKCRLGPAGGETLSLVLGHARIENAGDVIAVFFHFLEKRLIFFVAFLVDLDIFDLLGFALDDTHARALSLFFLGGGFFLVFFASDDDGLFLDTLGLFLLGLFVLVLLVLRLLGDDGRTDDLHRLRLAGAPLLEQGLRLERKLAFRTFDRTPLQVVETGLAGWANALGSEIGLGQSHASSSTGFQKAGSFATSGPLCKEEGRGCAGSRPGPLSGEAAGGLQAMNGQDRRPLSARKSGPLQGVAKVPGDKSISHRALILGALAVGETPVSGLLEAEDVVHTAKAMMQFGAEVTRVGEGEWRVWGRGVGGFSQPDGELDFGNSGTGSRLVMGAMATTPITAVFTGDASLRKRPMKRVLEPLEKFGATWSGEGGLMPIALTGADRPICVDYEVTVASAQVKSALLLAALNAPGRTRLTQSALTRDHTEKMLAAFGADVSAAPMVGGGERIEVMGEAELRPCAIQVPRDPSSAAFPLVAALIVPGSEVSIPDVLLNPRRIGLIETLLEMGADISITNRRISGGEEVGDLVVRHSNLRGVEVPPERAPSMIDEYPILAVAAANASGRTVMRGLEELRVKESDRLFAIINGLRACGVQVEELEDGMVIDGRPGDVPGSATITTHMDHRIAMAFLIAGLASRNSITVDDASMIATSFPEFESLMSALGSQLDGRG